MKKNFTSYLLIACAFLWTISMTASAQNSLYINFEGDAPADGTWVLENDDSAVSIAFETSDKAHSGSKIMKVSGFSINTGYHIYNSVDYIVVKPDEYIHTIVYGGCLEDGGLSAPSYYSDMNKPTPGFSFSLSTTDLSTLIYDKTKRQNTTGSDLKVYPRLRMKPGTTTNELYFDDMIIYADSNPATDLVEPDTATAFTLTKNAGAVELSWVEGVDSLSGVAQTLVLRANGTSVAVPVLKNQVAYSVEGGTAGDNQVGEWTVLAVLNKGTNVYTDNTVTEGEGYSYAVIHRDLAYNYSKATMQTISLLTSANDLRQLDFHCYGVEGEIRFEAMKPGSHIAVYSLTGALVHRQTIAGTSCSVPAKQGMYVVRVNEHSLKVIVR